MTINRRSVALGLTAGLLAGGAGGALAAVNSGRSTSGMSATATTWPGNGTWGGYGYAPGPSGYGARGGYGGNGGWDGDGGNGGYGGSYGGGWGDIGGMTFGRTATKAAAGYLDLTTPELKSRLRVGQDARRPRNLSAQARLGPGERDHRSDQQQCAVRQRAQRRPKGERSPPTRRHGSTRSSRTAARSPTGAGTGQTRARRSRIEPAFDCSQSSRRAK